jgi:hypothetical protein
MAYRNNCAYEEVVRVQRDVKTRAETGRAGIMDSILAEFDKLFENLVDNYEREPEIDERREMRESLQP